MTPAKSDLLHKKLGIKPGHTVCLINPPDGYMERLGAEVSQVRLIRGIEENADVIQAFVAKKDNLIASFPLLKEQLGRPHALWICWPRKLSGIPTDLNENPVREVGLESGLTDVKTCTIDDDWSGIKFVYKLSDR